MRVVAAMQMLTKRNEWSKEVFSQAICNIKGRLGASRNSLPPGEYLVTTAICE
jgi:hypothetical protein